MCGVNGEHTKHNDDHESDSDTGGNHTAASNGNAYGDAHVIRPLRGQEAAALGAAAVAALNPMFSFVGASVTNDVSGENRLCRRLFKGRADLRGHLHKDGE